MSKDSILREINNVLEENSMPYKARWLIGFKEVANIYYDVDGSPVAHRINSQGTLFRRFMRLFNINNTKDMLNAPESVRQILVLANKIG